MPIDFRIGDVVRLRKPHPCGSSDWTVVRIGADIGLRCVRCSRRVLLPRSLVERRLKGFVSRVERADPFGGAEGPDDPEVAPATPSPGAGEGHS